MIEIFTDGAAKGNPGPGGFGVVMRFGGKDRELAAGYRMTTNNRMELLAVIVALERIQKTDIPITVYSDSSYVVDAIEKGWLRNWMKKGFKGKKNVDLWRRLIPLLKKLKPKFVWIRGHAGHLENERCDYLAVRAAEEAPFNIDTAYEEGTSDA
jgi:ribonuclease HI